ncbi:MAG TPA: hypothetical protein VFA55_00620 [Candidatus Kapabacteria bacterium]|nr:hypothetical protein [Candidatus Kapabacteria bacterium]
MKVFILAVILFLPLAAFGQFKSQSRDAFPQEQPQERASNQDTSSPSGFLGLDLSNLSMHHSLSFSYMSMGGQSVGVNAYTNTLLYKFSPALQARADISLLYSPFNNLGPSAQSSINGLQLSNLSLDYKPAKNLRFSVSMQRYPYGLAPGYGSGFGAFSSFDQTQTESPDK